MKKNILSIICRVLLLIGIVPLFNACTNPDNYLWWSDITSISGNGVSDHEATMELGQTLQLSASPSDKGLGWSSSNEKVATINENGLVTAVGLGETTIRVYPKEYETAVNGNYVVVTVVNKSISFIDDQIDQSEAE